MGIKIETPGHNILREEAYSRVIGKDSEKIPAALYLDKFNKDIALNKAAIDLFKHRGFDAAEVYNLLKAEISQYGEDYAAVKGKIVPVEAHNPASHKIFSSKHYLAALYLKEQRSGNKHDIDSNRLEVSTTASQATLSDIMKSSAYSIAGYSGSLRDVEHMVKFNIGKDIARISQGKLIYELINVTDKDRISELTSLINKMNGTQNVQILVKSQADFEKLLANKDKQGE